MTNYWASNNIYTTTCMQYWASNTLGKKKCSEKRKNWRFF